MRHKTTTCSHIASRREPRCAPPARQAGVTLVELLTVAVIVALLLTIGMPSYHYVTTNNRMATESDSLLGDMQFARAEAIREGQQVSVCVSKTGTSCDSATLPPAWQEGWIIYSNPNNVTTVDGNDPLVRVDKGFSNNGDTFQATNSIYQVNFSGSGFANLGTATVFIKLHDPTGTSQYTRCLEITQAGMMSVVTTTVTGCT